MDDHAIVLNAGSSSLKFSIYKRPDSHADRGGAASADRGGEASTDRGGGASADSRGGGTSVPRWTLDLRGQIDGIGTSPRFTAKDGSDARVADDRLADGLDGRGAFDSLASWLRTRYGGGARVPGVGLPGVPRGPNIAAPPTRTR